MAENSSSPDLFVFTSTERQNKTTRLTDRFYTKLGAAFCYNIELRVIDPSKKAWISVALAALPNGGGMVMFPPREEAQDAVRQEQTDGQSPAEAAPAPTDDDVPPF